MKKKHRILNLYIIFALVMMLLVPMSVSYHSKAGVKGVMNSSAVSVRFRESPNGPVIKDTNGNEIYLAAGHELDILDTSNASWYKVSLVYGGKSYTGYVSAQFVSIVTSSGGGENVDPNTDFEGYLTAQGFPESYKPYLRQIHAAHPKWIFKAKQTGLNWGTVVQKETNSSINKVNTVQCTSSYPHYNWRSTDVNYSYTTDTWTPHDGSNWYLASKDLVTYYLDPRTYLYENYIFVFESLSYQSGAQTESGVEAILKGTFMSKTKPAGESETYAQIILRAAEESGVSAYHIAARIKQEMGATAGVAANGSYNGMYNFYNIGATDGSGAVYRGLDWAAGGTKKETTYGRPWNTPSKSIIGGAKWLGSGYISKGQNTLYTQKFNVTNSSSGLYSHQYMTNIQAPATECLSMYNSYKANGLLDTAIVFEIPVYYGISETATSKPADSGNPNNWLKTISVTGNSTTSVNYVTEYTYTFAASVTSVTVSATTVNANAKISGTGTYNLQPGTNILYVDVTAQNGAVKNYIIKLVRGDANAGTITLNSEVQTGVETPIIPPSTSTTGDVNGDGNISTLDIIKIQRIIVGLDINDVRADVNGDGQVSALDIIKIQRHIVGLESLY